MVFLVIPLYFYCLSFNPLFILRTELKMYIPFVFCIIAVYFIVDILNSLIRELSSKWSPWWFYRPKDADNCYVIKPGKEFGDKIDFPSITATITIFVFIVSTIYFFNKHPNYQLKFIIFAIICVLLASLGALMKNCNNIVQVLTGYIVGILCAYLFIKYWLVAQLGYQALHLPKIDTSGIIHKLNYTKPLL